MRKGENGIALVNRYASSAEIAKHSGASARRRASRGPGLTNDNATPLAPMPNKAIDTTRNAKWYQIETEKMRTKVT